MSTQGQWVGQWVGDWQGATGEGGVTEEPAALVVVGTGTATFAPVLRVYAALVDDGVGYATFSTAPTEVQRPKGGWSPAPKTRRKREPWRVALDELLAKPAPVVLVEAVEERIEARLTDAQQSYLDGLQALIVRAKNEQERARHIAQLATVEREAENAADMLRRAIEAERVAKRQIFDFDVAYVAAVLIEA